MLACTVDFVTSSALRAQRLTSIIDEASAATSKRRRLKTYAPTRWVERHDAVVVFAKMYSHLCSLFREIMERGDAKASANASALLNVITKTTFIVALSIAYTFKAFTAGPSATLQMSSIDLA